MTKGLVLNAADLSEVLFQFEPFEEIYAIDRARNRGASKNRVYDLATYSEVEPLPIQQPDHLFYSTDGTLYLLSNREGYLYALVLN